MTIPCGQDCPDRAVGCHSSCERYREYRAHLDARNSVIQHENSVLGGYLKKRREKIDKIMRKIKNKKET